MSESAINLCTIYSVSNRHYFTVIMLEQSPETYMKHNLLWKISYIHTARRNKLESRSIYWIILCLPRAQTASKGRLDLNWMLKGTGMLTETPEDIITSRTAAWAVGLQERNRGQLRGGVDHLVYFSYRQRFYRLIFPSYLLSVSALICTKVRDDFGILW